MSKITKSEKVKRIKQAFNDLGVDDIKELEKIMIEIKVFGLDSKRILEDQYITASKYSKLKPKLKKLIDEPPKEVKTEKDFTFEMDYLERDSIGRKEIALELLGPYFLKGRLHTDTIHNGFRVFAISDPKTKTCHKVTEEASGKTSEILTKLSAVLLANLSVASKSTLMDIKDFWDCYTPPVGGLPTTNGCPDGVVTCLSPLKPLQWNQYYSPYLPDKTVPFPLIKETLNRMSEGDAVAAFYWGIYTEKYRGRQILWLASDGSPNEAGEEGKSYFAKFIGATLFGENLGYKAINNTQIKAGSVFTTFAYIGAKFVLYPDCNNRHILKSELMKGLSGGGRDSTQTEEKYKSSQTSTLDARYQVNSNFLPSVVRAKWYLSRLLLSTISALNVPKDPNIDKKYLEELPGFLAYAEECYNRLCPDDEEIQMSQKTKDLINDLLDKEDPTMADIFIRHFVLDKTATTSYKEIKNIIQISEDDKSRDTLKEFKAYLESLPGVSLVRRKFGMGYEGIAVRGSQEVIVDTKFDDGWDLI